MKLKKALYGFIFILGVGAIVNCRGGCQPGAEPWTNRVQTRSSL